MTAQEFSEYRGKNVIIDGVTLPIVGYEKVVDSEILIVGVSKYIKYKETDSPSISIAWKTLCEDDVIEKECDYYSYASTNKVIL